MKKIRLDQPTQRPNEMLTTPAKRDVVKFHLCMEDKPPAGKKCYVCQYCGIYYARSPWCNKCEESD